MMSEPQVMIFTLFLRIIGAWMVVMWLMSRSQGSRNGTVAKPSALSFLFTYGVGIVAILFVSGVWWIPSGQSDGLTIAIVFSGASFVLYSFLIVIRTLPEAKHLKIAGVVTWLLVIAVTWIYSLESGFDLGTRNPWLRTAMFYSPMVTIVLLAMFLAVFAASDWVERFMKHWSDEALVDQGLPSAGKWIGRLERFLIVCCLLAGQPAGVAVLVTAKGILRFGEIKDDKDQQHQRKMVEYILIGSMFSYAIALSIGWMACFLILHVRYHGGPALPNDLMKMLM